MTKVINLFGAPGAGKSTIAAGLFYYMKIAGYNVERADEWIKDKVYEGTKYPFKDQLYTFAKQNKKIKQMLGKTDFIICDSPLFLSMVYQSEELPVFSQLVLDYFNSYDNTNFFIKRHHKYQPTGRIHSEKQSDSIALDLESKLRYYNIEYTVLTSGEAMDRILERMEVMKYA